MKYTKYEHLIHKRNKIQQLFKTATRDDGAELIRAAFSAQQKKYGKKTIDKYLLKEEKWTLVNFESGLIKGSNVCPHCEGFLGRGDEFYNDVECKNS